MARASENVFVGISLRNKQLTKEGVAEIVRVACMEMRAHRIAFLIADELEMINLRVLESGTQDKFRRLVETRARALENIIRSGADSHNHRHVQISVVRWNAILNAEYWRVYSQLFAMFIESVPFRADVEHITRSFVARRRGEVSSAELHHLSLYILGELPTLLRGITVGTKRYESMIYPSRGNEALDIIAEQISQGRYGICADCEKICTVRRMGI